MLPTLQRLHRRYSLPLLFVLAAPLILAGGAAATTWLLPISPLLALPVALIAGVDAVFALAAAVLIAQEPG